MFPKISLCMIVRNEEAQLSTCLEAARPYVDEMVVVDTGSTDQSMRIAQELGAVTGSFPWIDDFAAARNASLDLASGAWILYMDPDEILEGDDPNVLRKAAQNEGMDAYFIDLYNLLTEGSDQRDEKVPLLRFFRHRADIRFEGAVHEQVLPDSTRIGKLAAETYILHNGYLPTVVERKGKLHRNLEILLKALAQPQEPLQRHYFLFQTAREYQRFGDWSQALDYYNQVIQESDHLRPVYWPLAFQYSLECVIRLERWDTALEISASILQMFPSYTEVLRMRAAVLAQSGRLQESQEAYLTALSQPDERPWLVMSVPRIKEICWMELGNLYQSLDNLVSAVACYQKVLSLNPQACVALERTISLVARADGPLAVRDWLAALHHEGRLDACRNRLLTFLESQNLFDAYAVVASSPTPDVKEAV